MKLNDEIRRHLATLKIVPSFGKKPFKEYHVQIVERVDRKVYVQLDAVLVACGGQWNRKAKAHVFVTDPTALIDDVITVGEVATRTELDKAMGFFETPPALADELARIVVPGNVVLEPSAGNGRLVNAVLKAGAHRVLVCERDAERRAKLASIQPMQVVVLDTDDFLELSPLDRRLDAYSIDAVVMNPPFTCCGLGDHLDHVRHAHDFLRPRGRLVAVLPSSVTFRQDRRYRDFRDWVSVRSGSFSELPSGSFAPSGTNVNTVVLRMERK